MKIQTKLNASDLCKGLQTKAVETHAHIQGGSPCAKVSAEETVKSYAEAGYGALIITNHFNANTVPKPGLSPRQAVDYYVSLYEEAAEWGAKYSLDVWFGIETCISGGPEDFLIFGAGPELLYANPTMYDLTQQELFAECEQYGCLLYQAHPSRSNCQPRDPRYLHGAEVYNGNRHHQENNEASLLWAKKYCLLQSSGSDFHRPEDCARGGILVPSSIHTGKELAAYLAANEVTLITP